MGRGLALKRWRVGWRESRAGEARRRSFLPPTLLIGAYALAFAPLYRMLGTGVVALASLPVILIAARHGRNAGLATALLAIPLVTILLTVCTPQRGAFVLFAEGGGDAPGGTVNLSRRTAGRRGQGQAEVRSAAALRPRRARR